MTLAWKTAIGRNKPSAPLRALETKGLIVGDVLDYGCGKGYDAYYLGSDSYDRCTFCGRFNHVQHESA